MTAIEELESLLEPTKRCLKKSRPPKDGNVINRAVQGTRGVTRWMKHGAPCFISMMWKDVVVFGGTSFLSFVETSRTEKKEVIYHANSEIKGDGIQCCCTHRALPCFAFAEMCRNPRIFVVSYPSFEMVKTFESEAFTYLALSFSEMEFLVALTGIPDYKIIIWNWKTAEKLYTQPTKLKAPRQVLRISLTSPIQILQATAVDRELVFWDMNLCYKKTLLNKTTMTIPDKSRPPYCFAYGADGDLYFVDGQGSLYSINPETRVCSLQIPKGKEEEQEGAGEMTFTPALTWHKGGLVFSTPKEVHLWRRKSPEGWTKICSYVPKSPFRTFVSSPVKDLLIGVNVMNEIIALKWDGQLDKLETTTLKSMGADFDFVCIVHPVGDYVVTYGNALGLFTVWSKVTGHKESQLYCKGKITALECNPKWSYLVAGTADGEVNLISVHDPAKPYQLDDFPLTTNSIDAIRFKAQGTPFCVANMDVGEFFLLKVPLKLEVIAYLRIDLKIVDYTLVEKEANLYLLILPMSQLCCRSGQTILMYVLDEKTMYFEYVKDLGLPTVATSILPSPISPKELLCVSHRSRKFCVVSLINGKTVGKYVTGHQVKSFRIKCLEDYLVTFGIDGLVIVKMASTKECVTLCTNHHRHGMGTKNAIVDPYMKYIITLGTGGSLVCTLLKNIKNRHNLANRRLECEALFASPAHRYLLTGKLRVHIDVEGVDSGTKVKEPKKIWLVTRKQELIALEELQSRKEKQSIQEEFWSIQKTLRQLLDENFNNIPERQLPVQAFDLDKAARRKELEDAKSEREKEKQLQLAAMKNLSRISDIIKKTCWDSVEVKGREIHGIVAPVVVHSYSMLPDNRAFKLKMVWLSERIKVEQVFHKGDFFEPWIPRSESQLELHINKKFEVSSLDVTQTIKTKFEEEQMDEDKAKMESEEQKMRYVWTGTSTHQFVEVDPKHYSQFELTTFLQGQREIHLIEVEIKKLMLWFNKEFAQTLGLKEREMAFVYERNNRFRHIINELSFFNFSPAICNTQIYDPQWAPQEHPESIMTVEDNEINVPMYISESGMDLLRKKVAEEERQRQLLMADDFKERALMVMMDGVLEKLWEDEIKKDIPKPKCMVEKEPDTWTEDDLKAMRAYEEAVKFLASERERYRKILEAEWAKTIVTVKDSVSKFDEKLAKLHLLKLKVESAIGQEILKGLRIRKRCLERIEMDRKEDLIKSTSMKKEKKIESMGAELTKLLETLNECRNLYESLQNKDRNLDKNFKKEFPEYSPIICEQLYRLSKKRPKLLQKAASYSTVLVDMGKCAVSGIKPVYMPVECIQYLKDIDALDAYSNAPASVSPKSWELACKMRRQKIDTELKIRACAIDLADAEATVAGYQKALKAEKEQQVQLQNDLQSLRAEKLSSSLNYTIQLVLKKGWVEIPLTGCLSDFKECALVTKVTLNDINRSIQKMGHQKIKAMEKAANFRKGIIYKEWEHKKLRMEIEDLKSQLETVEKLQVLKELQAILVARARGFTEDKGFLYLENELTGVKEDIKKEEAKILKEMDELDAKIEKLNIENLGLDERLAELNVEVNELNLMRDTEFSQKDKEDNKRRMKKIRERSNLVRRIQEQHNEILVLQTELELLRLKTYPAIKYKIT